MVETAKEFKRARISLGLSVNDLSYILNTAPRTIIKWESPDNRRTPNPVACRVMEWILEGYEPPQLAFLTAVTTDEVLK